MSKITITVFGETGSGKSAIALEIQIALKAIGVPVINLVNPDTMVQAESQTWIDLYKPEVTIVEQNIPVAAGPAGGAVHCPICCHDVPSRCDNPKWCNFNIDEADVGVR